MLHKQASRLGLSTLSRGIGPERALRVLPLADMRTLLQRMASAPLDEARLVAQGARVVLGQ